MSGIKYYALDENEEVPYEFVVTRDVNGEPEFCASFVNTNSLAYGNGVLLKLHQRNDELRAENARLRSELESVGTAAYMYGRSDLKADNAKLLKLVRDMWRFTGAACKKYPRLFDPAAQGGQMVQLNAIDAFEQRMRELGIEVE